MPNPILRDIAVRGLIWIALFGIAVAAAVMIGTDDRRSIAGLSTDQFGALSFYSILAVAAGAAVVMVFRKRISRAIEAALFWLAVALVLFYGYTYRADLRVIADRAMAELMPGYAAKRGNNTVEIVRGRSGDFQVAAQVNGTRVAMALDTGASAVVLTQEAAKAVGLPVEMLSYTVQVDTANGRARAAAITLDRIAVGGIVERSVAALVAQPGQLRTSLLGMSFLNRLESWEARGDKLMLSFRGAPKARAWNDVAHFFSKLLDQTKLAANRAATSNRNMPKPISRCRRDSRCASRAP
jgi:aspartyl protease family protein